MRFLIALLALTAAAHAQSFNAVKIIPKQNGSATGTVDYFELYGNGSNYIGFQAPDSITTSFRLKYPSTPPTSGQCPVYTASGSTYTWAWGACVTTAQPREYDWSQTITAPGLAGTKTITLTPGPKGVSAADTLSQYRLSGSPGAAELVVSTGTGTCNGTGTQTSCTIQVVTANSHTGTTTLESATDGAQEAIMYQASGTTLVLFFAANLGGFTWYAPVYTQGRSVTFQGEGWNGSGQGSYIGLGTAGQKGIFHTDGVLRVNKIRMTGDNSTTAVYVNSTAANGSQMYVTDNWFEGHAISVQNRTTSDAYVEHNLFRTSTVCLDVGNELWGDQGGLFIRDNYFGCSSVNIAGHAIGGGYIQRNSFLGAENAVTLDFRMVKVNTSGTTVTTTADYVFGTGLTTGVSVYINGTGYTIATRDSSTQLTLTGSAGVQSNVDLGIGSSQLQIQQNNFDNADVTSILIGGTVLFGDIQIGESHFNRVTDDNAYDAISITNQKIYGVTITGNTFTNIAGNTSDATGIRGTATGYMFSAKSNTFTNLRYGVHLTLDGSNDYGLNVSTNSFDGLNVTTGTAIYISNAIYATINANQITRYNLGVQLAGASTALTRVTDTNMNCNGSTPVVVDVTAGASNINITGISAQSPCAYFVRVNAAVTADAVRVEGLSGTITTAPVSFGVAAKLIETRGLNFSDLPANVSNGSLIYCTDCRVSYDGVCTSGGAGAYTARLNSEWNCNLAYGNLNPTKPACVDATASPADCGTATTGSVTIAAGATSVVVNTARVTGSSQILALFDSSLGATLGVTCNTTFAAPYVTARSSGVSFTITIGAAPVTNPACFSFIILN